MPVAIPIIAGVAAAAGAVAVYAVPLATALSIGMAVASAAMMLTIKTPSFSDYTSTSERQQVLRASAANQVVVYGRIISSGLLSFAAEQAGSQDKGELLHLVVTLAGHKLSRIGTVWLGDDTIDTYGGDAQYEFHNDRQSADPFLLANCSDWKDDMIGKGLAWLRVTLKFDAEKFPSGLPNIKVEQFGREVWDPRDNKTKWSDNAALVILDYYRTILMVPDDELDIDTFAAAANVCDELITLADGTQERRYTINGSFEYTEAPAKILEAMHMACAGQPTYIGGRHSIIVGAYLGPASAEVHPHQIVGNIELLAEPSLSDQINTVTGTFIDPVTFEKADFPAASESAWLEEDGDIEKAEDLDLRFVTSSWQAQRLARIVLHQRRFATSMTLPLNISGWQYRPGSLLKLYLPAIGMNGVEFRVTDWDFSLTGGVNLSLRQESAAVWADAAGKTMERPDLTDLPSGGVAAPDQLRYEVEQVGETVQGRLSWHNAGLVAENKVIIQRLEPDTAPRTLLTVSVPGQSCPVSGLVMGAYVAQVRAVSYTGRLSSVASVAFTIEAPATPLAIEAEAGNWSLALRPVWYGGAQSTVLCEWWWSHSNVPLAEVESQASSIGVGSFMTLQGLRPDTEYYFWCRSVNAYGKSALCAGAAKTTYDAASILDVLDGEIGAEHLREELRKPIESIDGIKVTVTAIDKTLTELDTRQNAINDVLKVAQDQLGENYVNVTLIQEALRQRIDKYRLDFDSFRDAVFAVDPSTGEITMDAVYAVRSELGAEITAVSQHLSAVEAIVNTCVTRAELSKDLERITVIEQDIDGIQGTLRQTATKSEMNALGSTVTQVEQALDATNAALTQKAAQSAVDAQGQRLAAAEQKLVANTSATEAAAQRIERVMAELQQADQTINAAITTLTQAVASETQALAQRVDGVEASVTGHSAAISELQKVVTGDDMSLAERFENIRAEVDIAAESAVGAALATAAENTRQRLASGQIRRDQQVIVDAHQALARVVEEIRADYQTADADLGASITSVREALTSETEALASLITRLRAEYKSADDDAAQATAAAIQSEQTARAAADEALGKRVDTVQATAAGHTAAIQAEQTARIAADEALGRLVDTVQATAAGNAAAIQTVAEATANIKGAVEAGWYTKAQINGAGGGFGLSVQLNSDGTTLTSFVVDADVFAVLSRTAGVTSQRHPFVVKNGTVYLNHAMMETAEITNLIAAAIKTVTLSAITIDNSVFKGGAAAFGRGGPHVAFGETWYTTISSDGTIATNRLQASAGEFAGTIKANAGEMNNVTIKENCTILGTTYADRLVGDVFIERVKRINQTNMPAYTGSRVWRTVGSAVVESADSNVRTVVVTGLETSVTVSGGQTGDAQVRLLFNGTQVDLVSASVTAPAQGASVTSASGNFIHILPAGETGTYEIQYSGANYSGGWYRAPLLSFRIGRQSGTLS